MTSTPEYPLTDYTEALRKRIVMLSQDSNTEAERDQLWKYIDFLDSAAQMMSMVPAHFIQGSVVINDESYAYFDNLEKLKEQTIAKLITSSNPDQKKTARASAIVNSLDYRPIVGLEQKKPAIEGIIALLDNKPVDVPHADGMVVSHPASTICKYINEYYRKLEYYVDQHDKISTMAAATSSTYEEKIDAVIATLAAKPQDESLARPLTFLRALKTYVQSSGLEVCPDRPRIFEFSQTHAPSSKLKDEEKSIRDVLSSKETSRIERYRVFKEGHDTNFGYSVIIGNTSQNLRSVEELLNSSEMRGCLAKKSDQHVSLSPKEIDEFLDITKNLLHYLKSNDQQLGK